VSLGHADDQCGGVKRHAGVDWVRRDVRTVPNGGLPARRAAGQANDSL